MICPSCGSSVPSARFCENCGAPLSIADEVRSASYTQPISADTSGIDVMAGEASQTGFDSSSYPTQQYQPYQPYEPDPTMQMPQASYTQQNYTAQQNSYSQPGTYAAGGYSAAGNTNAQGTAAYPYGGAAPYTGAAGPSTTVPNTAFALAIVGMILCITGVGAFIGFILCIVALVMNAKNNKSLLDNPHKNSVRVMSIIGLVFAVLSLLATIAIGMLAYETYTELEENGFDPETMEIVLDDEKGEIRIIDKPR